MSDKGFLSVTDDQDELFTKHLGERDTQFQLAALMNDASIDRILAFDKDLRIIAWNEMCQTVSGLEKQDAIGRNYYDAMPGANECAYIAKAIQLALRGFKSFVPSDKGSYGGGYYEHHFIPLKGDKDNVIGVLNVIHDVAHRVKAEKELKSLNKSLAKKNKELKQKNAELLAYTDVTAHELKEPLWRIYSFVEKIASGDADKLSAEGKNYFKRIQASARRMMLLTDDVLTYLGLHMQATAATEVDLNQTMKFVLNELDESIRSSGAVIDVAPLPVITGYRTLLAQLFQNILNNALKFQEKGNAPRISVTAAYHKGADLKHSDVNTESDYVCISVTDNGIGFSKKHKEKIFEMFHKLHNEEEYAGTGIGLATSQKIAVLHHGFITADSVPGEGSTFDCYLEIRSGK